MARFSVAAACVTALVTLGLVAPGAASAATTKLVTVAAVSQSTTYGASEPRLTYTVTGLAKRDSLTRKPTCTVPAHRAIGRYPISCSGAKADPARYTIRYVTGTLDVGRAHVVVAPDYQLKFYAAADPETFSYTPLGFVRGDTFVTAPTCGVDGPHSDVGHYSVTCSGADAGPNYAIDYWPGYYDVVKSPVFVAPDQKIVFYGAKDPDFTWDVQGLKDGEELLTDPVCGVRGAHEHVGAYSIECTGAKASTNYDLVSVAGPFSVLQTFSSVIGEKPSYSYGLLGQLGDPTGATLAATLDVALGGTYETYGDAPLVFTSGDTTLCSATTDSSGRATCSLDAAAAKLVRDHGYTVTYAGNDDISGSHHDVNG